MSLAIYDAAILGGGPAGAVAARLLASWGHSVILLTGTGGPAFAESLPPSAEKLLDRGGVLQAVRGPGFLRSRGNAVHWANESSVELFPAPARGYQVERGR